MTSAEPIAALKSLGLVSAGILADVGITSLIQLQSLGAVASFAAVR